MKLPSIRQVFLEARRAATRFPFVLLCAFVGVWTIITLIESEPPKSVGFPIVFAAMLGLLLLTALALCAEKRQWSRGLSMAIQWTGVLLLVVYGFSVPTSFPSEQADFFIRFGLLAVGLVLLLMILPYLKKGEVNGFWQYNKTLFFRLFVTAIFSAVLFGGLAIALAALNNLFGVSVPAQRYAELWLVVAGLFGPWFFLAGVPENLEDLDRVEEYPKGLKIFAQYILLSLVVVYLLILYAYLLKILLQWSWPKGWVSSLILGFSAISILSLLLMHPIRERSENAWIRAAGQWLYIVLIPLIVVLFLAVTERIGDYGITETRYAGIALGIWLTAQVLYFLFSKSKSIKFTIASLCLFAFLMSVGPWGMLSISQRSQVGRLSRLLTKNGILVSGKVQKEHGNVSQEESQEISSIVSYLNRVHGYDAIRPWFADNLREEAQSGSARGLPARDVLDRMGVEYFGYQADTSRMLLALDLKRPIDISDYDRVLARQSLSEYQNKELRHFEGNGISYRVNDSLRAMTVAIGDAQSGTGSIPFDIGAFADRLQREYGNAGTAITGKMAPEIMSLIAENNGHKVKLLFVNLNLRRQSGQLVISSFTADIAYTIRK